MSETKQPGAAGAFLFFALTYTFSWTVFYLGWRTGIEPLLLLGVWGPTLSALALTLLFYGRSGILQMLRRFGRVRIGVQWWALLLLLPASIHFVGIALWQLISGGPVDVYVTPPQYWPGAIIPSILIAGLGEELGWRGYALPRLQTSVTPLAAALILGITHIFWHMPTYWLGQGIHNVPALWVFGFGVPWTIIFVWLYNKSGGSLLFAVGFHAISNASLSIVRFMPLDREVPITPELITRLELPADLAGPYLIVICVYWIAALLVIALGGLKTGNTDTP